MYFVDLTGLGQPASTSGTTAMKSDAHDPTARGFVHFVLKTYFAIFKSCQVLTKYIKKTADADFLVFCGDSFITEWNKKEKFTPEEIKQIAEGFIQHTINEC